MTKHGQTKQPSKEIQGMFLSMYATRYPYLVPLPGVRELIPELPPLPRTHCSYASVRKSIRVELGQGTSQRSSPMFYYLHLKGEFLHDKISCRYLDDKGGSHHGPSSSRPRNAGARSFNLGGRTSRRPTGTYRCIKERASQRYRRVVLTPAVSDPK